MATNTNAYRAKWGVITPAANTVIEHDMAVLRPHGMTFHVGRMRLQNPTIDSDENFTRILDELAASTEQALDDVMFTEPDHIILGVSAEAFNGGVKGNDGMIEKLERLSGLQVTTSPSACVEAFRTLGVRRIGILSPYQRVGDEQVTRFFEESGLDVVAYHGLRCPTVAEIAKVSEHDLARAAVGLDGADVEAILQVGANLPMLNVAPKVETVLGKPVLAINAATLWWALRRNGFDDRSGAHGVLLREH